MFGEVDATFLFTDLEGSTRMWQRHPNAMHRVLALHDEILTDAIEANDGQIFKHTGDGLCAIFATVDNAAFAAQLIQRRVAAASFDPLDGLRVRIGIHAGIGVERQGDYFGLDVSHTARVMSAAHGGQVLLSSAAHDTLTADLLTRPLGEHRLRDRPDPERLYQLVVPDLPDSFPPLRTLTTAPNNLPTLTSSFVGRTRELAELADRLRVNRLVTVVGPGGSGKTRLAIEVGADQLSGMSGGVWLAQLVEASSTIEVESAVAEVLAPVLHHADAADEAPSALVVLDNCEHVVDILAPIVHDLLVDNRRITVLATSRRPLEVPGESVFRLGPMTQLGPGATDEASLLFDIRARAASRDFELGDHNRADVSVLCRRLDGLPLGIELAAARAASLSPDRMLALLDTRLDAIGTRYAAERRHRSLTSVVEWSYQLLNEREQELLCKLSVFRGGFTLDSAAAVVSADDADVAVMVSELVDVSILSSYQPPASRRRYRLLETIALFARDRLEAAGNGGAARMAHLSHFRDRAAEISMDRLAGRRGREWLSRWTEDLDNIRAALDRAIDMHDFDATFDLLRGFVRISSFKSWGVEAVEVIDRVFEEFEGGIPFHRIPSMQTLLGIALFHAGDLPRCITVLEAATKRFSELQERDPDSPDLEDYPGALNTLAEAYHLSGLGGEQNRRYLELIEKSLEMSQELEQAYGTAVARSKLAEHGRHATVEEARKRFDEAEEAAIALDSPERIGTVQTQRASFEAAQGDLAAAREHWRRSVEAFGESGDEASRLTSAMLVGTCDVLLGDPTGLDRFREHAGQLFDVLESDAPVHHPLLAIRAVIDAALGRFDRVARASGMSQTLETMGLGLRADLVGDFRKAQQAATQALGEAAFHAAQRDGRRTTRDEIRNFVVTP